MSAAGTTDGSPTAIRRLAALTPIALAGVAAWIYPALTRRAERGFWQVELVLAIPLFLGLLWLLAKATAPRLQPGPAPSRARLALVFGVGMLLFCLSAGRDLDKFPRLLDGESAEATRRANLILSAPAERTVGEMLREDTRGYNFGLVPILTPVIYFFGPGYPVVKWTNIVVVAALFAGALTLLAARFPVSTPAPVWWLLWLNPLCYGTLLASVRQYRWHLFAVAASLGVAIASRALERDRQTGVLVRGLLLAGVGLLLYHGSAVCLVVLLSLSTWHLLQPEDGRRRWRIALLLVPYAFVFLITLWALTEADGGVFSRAQSDLAGVSKFFSVGQRIEMAHRFMCVPRDQLTWLGGTVAMIGLAGLLQRVRHSALARACVLILGAGLGVNFVLRGLGNPSLHFSFLVGALACAALGLAEIAERLAFACPSPRIAAALGIAVCLGLAGQEWTAYRDLRIHQRLDGAPNEWHSEEQFALVVGEIAREQSVESVPTRHFLSSHEISAPDGGFERQVSLENVGARGLREVHEFTSVEDLAAKLEVSAPAGGADVVWLSWQPAWARPHPTALEQWLLAHGFRRKLFCLEVDRSLDTMNAWKFSRSRLGFTVSP